MTIRMQPRRSFVRRTALLLAIAGAGYLAVALFHDTASFDDGSAAFAQPAQAAASSHRELLPATRAVPPAGAVDWGRSGGELIQNPRECDLEKGISTACLFMD